MGKLICGVMFIVGSCNIKMNLTYAPLNNDEKGNTAKRSAIFISFGLNKHEMYRKLLKNQLFFLIPD